MSNKEVKENVSLRPSKLKDATYGIKTLSCVIPHGITVEQILKPEFWKHNANMLAPNTQIYCEFEDGSRFLWLVVLSNGDTWAKVEVILDKAFGEKSEKEAIKMKQEDDDAFIVVWGNRETQYRVIRSSDNVEIEKGFAQKEEAFKWLLQYKASLSA